MLKNILQIKQKNYFKNELIKKIREEIKEEVLNE